MPSPRMGKMPMPREKMARARSILKRVKAVTSTRTITRTMEMISTARFKKVHNRVVAARPYTDGMAHVVAELVAGLGGQDASHPLLTSSGADERAVLVFTGNRGLCGAYNTSVLRLAGRHLDETKGHPLQLHVVGKRGVQYFRFRRVTVAKSYADFDYIPDYARVSALADEFIAQFIEKKIGSLHVVYMRFVSAGQQKPVVEQLLPLAVPKAAVGEKAMDSRPVYDFVPSAKDVLAKLLPAEVRLRLFQAFLDAAVSEQISRMTSMRAATDNADDMIHALTLKYNRMRQSQITTELAEIMGGRAALSKK